MWGQTCVFALRRVKLFFSAIPGHIKYNYLIIKELLLKTYIFQ
jgi:hypothetical protein